MKFHLEPNDIALIKRVGGNLTLKSTWLGGTVPRTFQSQRCGGVKPDSR
jgi:hypothetical protein